MRAPLTRRAFVASAAATVIQPAIARAGSHANAISFFADETAPRNENAFWKEAGVIDVSRSPFAKLKTVPGGAVVTEDGSWSRRRKTNVEASIPSRHDELVAMGAWTMSCG